MTDSVSKKTRSLIMSHIKSKNTVIEKVFRYFLWKEGIRYRLNSKLFGKPDISIKKYKLVVFIDSCFWHGCKEHCRIPHSNTKYWKEKINRNIKRDNEVSQYYVNNGWKIIRIWEHQINDAREIQKSIKKILLYIKSVKEDL